MLKFKKDGKTLGVLKDDATEPEGEAFQYQDIKDTNHIEPAEPKEEKAEQESEDATVE